MKSTALGRAVRPRSQAIRASADVSALVCLAMVERAEQFQVSRRISAPGRNPYGRGSPLQRGSRETALRSARAPADRPISASSAAARTAVPSISVPLADENDRALAGSGARGVSGVPSGCAGWRSLAASPREGREARAGRVARAGRAARVEGLSRLSLRRCGRRRGSPVRTSDFASSLISFHIIAHARRRVRKSNARFRSAAHRGAGSHILSRRSRRATVRPSDGRRGNHLRISPSAGANRPRKGP